jgi:hypothetical protein
VYIAIEGEYLMVDSLLKSIWASAVELWGHDLADYLLHAYIILNFGRDSLKKLSYDEKSELKSWLDRLGG